MCVWNVSNLHQQRVCRPSVNDTPAHFGLLFSIAVVSVDGVKAAAFKIKAKKHNKTIQNSVWHSEACSITADTSFRPLRPIFVQYFHHELSILEVSPVTCGGAAVLRILREGHRSLHTVLFHLLDGVLCQGVDVAETDVELVRSWRRRHREMTKTKIEHYSRSGWQEARSDTEMSLQWTLEIRASLRIYSNTLRYECPEIRACLRDTSTENSVLCLRYPRDFSLCR